MIIKFKDLHSIDFTFSEVVASHIISSYEDFFSYESSGRTKHLIFYQYKNQRCYYRKNTHLCTLSEGDIVFIPHGIKYHTFSKDKRNLSTGIGVSFKLISSEGEEIFLDEDVTILLNDNVEAYYKYFEKIAFSVMNPIQNILTLKSSLYFIMDTIFGNEKIHIKIPEKFSDIEKAINILENQPEKNIATKELAELCFMSESSFLRKFKKYSGGIPPIKYRNNIRLILAAELSASPLTTSEIAQKLGFYDSAHLCREYKKQNQTTLKKL